MNAVHNTMRTNAAVFGLTRPYAKARVAGLLEALDLSNRAEAAGAPRESG